MIDRAKIGGGTFRYIECTWCHERVSSRMLQKHFSQSCQSCPRPKDGFRICTDCQQSLPVGSFTNRDSRIRAACNYHCLECTSKSAAASRERSGKTPIKHRTHYVGRALPKECLWCHATVAQKSLQRHFRTDCLKCPRPVEGAMICTTCQQQFPLESFRTKASGSAARINYHCLTCNSAKMRQWTRDPRGIVIVRDRRLMKYGIDHAEYLRMLEAQQGKCAICHRIPTGDNSRSNTLHVDHDHATGKVRGLVDGNCNLIIGHAQDNIAILESAIAYLRFHQTVAVSE